MCVHKHAVIGDGMLVKSLTGLNDTQTLTLEQRIQTKRDTDK